MVYGRVAAKSIEGGCVGELKTNDQEDQLPFRARGSSPRRHSHKVDGIEHGTECRASPIKWSPPARGPVEAAASYRQFAAVRAKHTSRSAILKRSSSMRVRQ
jgi:hypothetical protein